MYFQILTKVSNEEHSVILWFLDQMLLKREDAFLVFLGEFLETKPPISLNMGAINVLIISFFLENLYVLHGFLSQHQFLGCLEMERLREWRSSKLRRTTSSVARSW